MKIEWQQLSIPVSVRVQLAAMDTKILEGALGSGH
jgi:hypothetical protein